MNRDFLTFTRGIASKSLSFWAANCRATFCALLDSHTLSLASLRGDVVMIQSDPELLHASSGRCRDDLPNEPHQTLRPTSRFRSQEDDDGASGGLRHAAGVWRRVVEKRSRRRKS